MRLLLPFFIACGALWAQSADLWISGGGSFLASKAIGTTQPDGASSDIQLGDGFRLSFRYGYDHAGHLGQEIQYGYNRSLLKDSLGTILPEVGSGGMAIHQGGYNVMYFLNSAREKVHGRPFATVGVHFNDYVLPGNASPQGGSFRFGFNYGGGIKFRLSPLFGFRIDIREYHTGKPNWRGILSQQNGILSQGEASAGFGFYF